MNSLNSWFLVVRVLKTVLVRVQVETLSSCYHSNQKQMNVSERTCRPDLLDVYGRFKSEQDIQWKMTEVHTEIKKCFSSPVKGLFLCQFNIHRCLFSTFSRVCRVYYHLSFVSFFPLILSESDD